MRRLPILSAAGALLLAVACARAGGVEKLYEVEMTARPAAVPAGQNGKVELKLKMKPGAHISAEAPLKVSLTAKNLKLEKDKLGRTDAEHQEDGPLFVVPFTAASPGPASVEADMVFFVCTDKLCERQARKVSIPVEVK